MREILTRLASVRFVLLWNVWLTLLFAVVIFTPEDVARWFAYPLLASWVIAGLVNINVTQRFRRALQQHAPEVAERVGSTGGFWFNPLAQRRVASLTLLKSLRTDSDLGPYARALALAYWYPLVLFVLAILGFAYMSQR